MPILPREPDCHPADLLEQQQSLETPWWVLYTKPRQEKVVMRRLREVDVPYYAPVIEQRHRSPEGRLRTSHVPLFATYVFMRGDDVERHQAVCTGAVTRAMLVHEREDLLTDLRQIQNLVAMGVPLTIESRIEAGQQVRVRNGAFAGYEGIVIRRENQTRLLVYVRFMDSGVSVKLDDCQLERID